MDVYTSDYVDSLSILSLSRELIDKDNRCAVFPSISHPGSELCVGSLG